MTKRRVAVLGGGVGALSAVWALTSLPGARDDYDVHVYQMGWRLGGKCASGRNAAQGQRIEEHGLHVWSGFYDNAFAMMREILGAVAQEPGTFHSLDDAFFKSNNVVLAERAGPGWTPWVVRPPMKESEPGIGGQDLTPWGYFVKLVELMRDTLDQLDPDHARGVGAFALPPGDLGGHLLTRLAGRVQAAGEAPLHLLQTLARALPGGFRGGFDLDEAALGELARQVQEDLRARRGRLALGEDLRRMHTLLDLGAAALKGMIEDRLHSRGFEAIDGEEISHWLERHGADHDSLESAPMIAVYDYVFGFRQGLTTRSARAIAAGTFLRGTLRLMLTYKGAIFYKMRAGMGDTIFTPLYRALRKRGVTFHFFHRVTGLHLDPAGRSIEGISVERQATTRGDYDPFVPVRGLDCWPSEPRWEQIEEADALRAGPGGRPFDLESYRSGWAGVENLQLRRGQDFDEVILGIPLGALPQVASELIAADPAWKRMVTRVETTATQAVQLWLDGSTEELGWTHGPAIMTAYADPLNTWADMSHLLPVEEWPEGIETGSVAYFCGPLADPPGGAGAPDSDQRERARDEVREGALAWMTGHAGFIFPRLVGPDGRLDLGRLVCAGATTPEARWAGQYFRANIEPSERYVLSVPGSTSARLRADRSGFANLWLAGDWTYTGLNAGCVEAAVMSGMRAAAGLAGIAPRIVGEEEDPLPAEPGTDAPQPPVLKTYRPQNSPWPWSAAYGMAETTGPCVTLPFPREAVERMLPAGLRLTPQTLTGAGEHPVILLFGQQREVRMNLMPFGMKSYLEFICAVPFVAHTEAALSGMPPMIWPQKLYLDSQPPIALGVYGYGFPKELAEISIDDESYVVRDPRSGQEIVACAWRSAGPRDRSYAFPHFATVRPAYEMAMVTQRRIGGWQYSVYDFSLDSALLEPLEMEVRVGENGFGLPPGLHRPPSIAGGALGGFFLTADGTINNPLQSLDIRRRLRDMGA